VSGKTTIPLARHRYDADALGGDDACVDRSDDGHCSVEDIDLFSNIAADDESDFGIDNHDKSSTFAT
jgi:hypothetical protein